MAKYTVEHTCGHEQTHNLVGPGRDRESKLSWLGTTLCSECYSEKLKADNAAASVKAAESNAAAGLPALTGSDKQIAWAESIRLPVIRAFRAAEALIASWSVEEEYSPESIEEIADAVTLVADEVIGQTSSKWWIDSGRNLPTEPAPAARHINKTARERGLFPAALAESQRKVEAEKKAREDKSRADSELMAAIAADTEDWAPSFDPATSTVTATAAGHLIGLRLNYGGYVPILVDGREVYGLDEHRVKVSERLRTFGEAAYEAHQHALATTRADALARATVGKVAKKSKQRLEITLTDGRHLEGFTSRTAWSVNRLNGLPIPTDHPDARRIAAEAKAWVASHKEG